MGVAVNVAAAPAQMLLEPEIVTEGALGVVIFIVIELEFAVVVLKQVALDVSTQVTTSPLAKLVEEYVLLLVPTVALFTFHW